MARLYVADIESYQPCGGLIYNPHGPAILGKTLAYLRRQLFTYKKNSNPILHAP